MARILIAYATKNGSTTGIAEAISEELRSSGNTAEVAEMNRVKQLDGYDAVILGAPLYCGKPLDLEKFTGKFRDALAKVPVAAFAVGISPVSKDEKQVSQAMKLLRESLGSLEPVAETVFAGKLDPARINYNTRKLMSLGNLPTGDFRDWTAIAAWAEEVAEKIKS
ncbi:MAG: flavodoxin domain-containing protein [Methanoregulaceae archaeon]